MFSSGNSIQGDFWTLEELTTLNYFKELSQRYSCYITANRAVALIKKITPIEHPAERLYTLLGGFLQFLTQTDTPEFPWTLFEIKVIQEAGLFSMNLIQKAIAEYGLRLSVDEISLIQTFVDSRNQQWLFSRTPAEVAVLQKLEFLLRRIREDYGLPGAVAK